MKREIKNLVKDRVRLRTIGRTHELPGPVQTQLQRALDATAHFTDYTLVLAFNYGSRTEMVDAACAYACQAVAAGREKLNDASWATFSRYLYTSRPARPRPRHPHLGRRRA